MKKLSTSVLLMIILAFSHSSWVSACMPIKIKDWALSIQKRIKITPLIFIGEVISSSEQAYKIKVLDVFKGDVKPESILVGVKKYSDCSNNPDKGLWIIYGSLKDSTTLERTDMGPSRSLRDLSMFPFPPVPPSIVDSIEIKEYEEQQINERLPELVRDWVNEYALLTAYRNRVQQQKPVEKNDKEYPPSIAIGVSVLTLGMTLFNKRR